MSVAQFRRVGRPLVIRLMTQNQISEGEGEGEGVPEIPSPKINSKPYRESLEPYQHCFKDSDLPSLTNGSSRGSRTPSVATDFEPSNVGLDIPSREREDLWPSLSSTMPCSSDPQAIEG